MIRADILRATLFQSDLCEDWDLTLDLYLQGKHYERIEPNDNNYNHYADNDDISLHSRTVITFDPCLECYCEASMNFRSYFRQRRRVSEGHTQAFRKRLLLILESNRLSFKDKIEIIFTGLQYAKFIFIPIVLILDIFMMTSLSPLSISITSLYLATDGDNLLQIMLSSASLQAICILSALASIVIGTKSCSKIRKYGMRDIIDLLAVNILTMPAFIIGSLREFLRNNGIFYRTQRNVPLREIQDSAT